MNRDQAVEHYRDKRRSPQRASTQKHRLTGIRQPEGHTIALHSETRPLSGK